MTRSLLAAALFALAAPSIALADEPAAPVSAPSPDDMAAAADATAAAASVPATPPAAAPAADPPAAAAKSDDIDLASLGLDPTATASFDDKLNLYGFADLGYTAFHFRQPNPLLADSAEFFSGNLNLYMAKNLTQRWRFMAEVRFTHLPNGGTRADNSIVTTEVGDPTNFSRDVSPGGILIERAYVEYDLNKHLTLRAGRFLTPYGIWNTDHGSPAIIAAYRPYIIGEGYFPEHQTGLELYGTRRVGESKLGYHATLTNGRSPVEATTDPDRRPAVGGRLFVETPLAGTLKVGVSGYAGRYTGVAAAGATPDSYTERSYAADAQWDHGGLHLQGEVIGNDKHYLADQRARALTGGFNADGRQWGWYALAGYRTKVLWNVMPFAFYEYLKPIDKSLFSTVVAYNAGLNFRPSANVIMKVQYGFAQLNDGQLFGNADIDIVTTQLAVVF